MTNPDLLAEYQFKNDSIKRKDQNSYFLSNLCLAKMFIRAFNGNW